MLFILSIDANEKSINFPSNKGFFKHSQISMPVAVLWKTKKNAISGGRLKCRCKLWKSCIKFI